jgi:hypothetical protein
VGATPRLTCADPVDRCDEWLNCAIPVDKRKIFQPRKILKAIFDEGSLFEIAPDFGGSTITCLARLNGHAVGVMTNNPMIMGGALTRGAALKMARFVDLCDTFHLPSSTWPTSRAYDGPRRRTRRHDGCCYAGLNAIEQSGAPGWIVLRAVSPAGAMLSPGTGRRARHYRTAMPGLPRAKFDPIEGGVAAAYKKDIAPPPTRCAPLTSRRIVTPSPRHYARRNAGVPDIIEPASTRPLLCAWVEDVPRHRPPPGGRTDDALKRQEAPMNIISASESGRRHRARRHLGLR